VNVERLAMGVGGFLVAYVSITVLISNGFDNALMMVFVSGVVASVAFMAFQIRANHKR
jgi:predicted membrane-bound spermidine synthase